MKYFLQRSIVVLLLLFCISGARAGSDYFNSKMSSVDYADLNNEQQELVKAELEAYEQAVAPLYTTNLDEYKKKLNDLFAKLSFGFKVYNLTGRNKALEDSLDIFYGQTNLRVYVVSYVEGAFLNNLFQKLAELKYRVRINTSIEIKFKFKKQDENSEVDMFNYTAEVVINDAVKDTLRNLIRVKLQKQNDIENTLNNLTASTSGENYAIFKTTSEIEVNQKVEAILERFNGLVCESCKSTSTLAINDDCNKISENLKTVVTGAKRCDFFRDNPDDEIEKITDKDLANLCIEDRMHLLKCIDDFPAGDKNEESMLKILTTTPVKDRVALLKRMKDEFEVEKLINAFHGEEFEKLIKELCNWKGVATDAEFESTVLNKRLFFFNYGDGLPYTFDGQGNMNFKSRKNFTITYDQNVTASPFEYVTVVFMSDFIIGGKKFQAEEVYTMLGLEVWSLFNESENKKWKIAGSLVADIPLMYVGIGQINTARKFAQLAKAIRVARGITTIAVATGGLAMAFGLEDELSLTPEGQEIVKYWTYFNLIYTGLTLGPVAIKTGKSLYVSIKTFLTNPNLKPALKVKVQKMLDDLTNLFKSKGQNLDDAAKIDFNSLSNLLKGKYPNIFSKFNQWDEAFKKQFYDDFPSEDLLAALNKEANLVDVWKNSLRSSDIKALRDFLSKAGIRDQYMKAVENLQQIGKNLLAQGKSKEEVARYLHKARRDIGEQYKNATPPDLLEWIYRFNLKRYADKLGPKFDDLFKGNITKGLSADAAYDKIIAASATSRGNKQALAKEMQKWMQGEPDFADLEKLILKYRMD